jgi:cation transport ATPase
MQAVERLDIARVCLVVIAAAAVWFQVWEPLARVSVIGVVAMLIGGYPIFKEAVENVREGKMTMELSMTIALVAALLIGEFFTALVITGLVLAAEILEGLTVARGRWAIGQLLAYLPRSATVGKGAVVGGGVGLAAGLIAGLVFGPGCEEGHAGCTAGVIIGGTATGALIGAIAGAAGGKD